VIGSLRVDARAFVEAGGPGSRCDAVACEMPIFAVADGVDHAAGSGERVLDQVVRLLRRSVGQRDLRNALRAANWSSWYDDPTTARSVATITIARVDHRRVLIGHVGDSRAYLARRGRAHQLTADHIGLVTAAPRIPAARRASAEAPRTC
jgi:serine/threonine protein phosphatase PrpC